MSQQHNHYVSRTVRTVFGLFLYACGSYCVLRANVGLGPWEAFGVGVSYHVPLTYGDISILTGLVILVFDFFLKEAIGVGTILNTVLIGKFVDLLLTIDPVPMMSNFGLGILLLLTGQVIVAFASYFYIGTGLGCGPRDALMTALSKRLPKAPIGLIRGMIEGTALLIGFILGAKVGIGTVLSIFGISFVIQLVFGMLKFDVKAVQHENIVQTFRNLVKKAA